MRYVLGSLFAIAAILSFSFGESEAACRAAGDYRLNGPSLVGWATLAETASDESFSSGTVTMTLFPKQSCPVCLMASNTLTGQYHTGPTSDGGGCVLVLNVLEAGTGRIGNVSGMIAFGGAVILFENYVSLAPLYVDLNLTLGIRSDSLLRP